MTDPNRYLNDFSGEQQSDLDAQQPLSGMPNAAQPPIQVESQEDQDIAALHSAEADFYNEQRKQESGATQLAAMRRASSMTPDYAAYCDKLSTDLDVPFNAVTHDKEAARKEADVPAWESIARFAPKTSALLQEKPEIFHQVQDDASALKDLEVFKRELKNSGITEDDFNDASKKVFDPAESIKAELNRSLESGVPYVMPSRQNSSFFTNLDAVGTQFNESALQADIGIRSLLNNMQESYGAISPEEAQSNRDNFASEYQDSAFRSSEATPNFEHTLFPKTNEFVFGGASSLVQSAPAMAVGLLNPLAGVLVAGAQTTATAYPKYSSRGGSMAESLLGAGIEGLIEMATEKNPMGFAAEHLGKMSIKNFAKQFLGKEMIGEQLATFGQDLTDTLIANSNKTMAQFWDERPEAMVQTLFAVGMNTAAMASVQHIANTAMKYDGSYEANQKLNQEMEIVKKLKVAGLNTVRAKQILDNMDGDSAPDVYVDPQQLFNQGQISPQQFKNAMPNYSTQLDEALAVGGLLRMDKNELMLAMRNDEEGWASLSQHLKVDPAADSLYESTQSMDALTDELNKLADKRIAESKDEAEARDKWEALKEKARQRLADSGMDKEAIEHAATMDASVAHAFSTRTGLDAGDILSEQFGRVSRRLSSGEILGGVFNKYAGEQALNADMTALQRAKQSVESGADPEQVRQETGWHKWEDGKWRFEIEAMDTGSRAGMSAEERKLNKPYISQGIPDDQIIVRVRGSFRGNAENINSIDNGGAQGVASTSEVTDNESIKQNNKQSRGSSDLLARLQQWSSEFDDDGRGGVGVVAQQWAEPDAYKEKRSSNPFITADEIVATEEEGKTEQNKLIQAAKENGFYIDGDSPIIYAAALHENKGGMEHDAYIVGEPNRRVVIRNTIGNFGHSSPHSPAQYLQRLKDYNATFPEHPIEFLGVNKDKDGVVRMFTAQAFIPGKELKTKAELDMLMRKAGWFELGAASTANKDRPGRYKNKNTGAIIGDVHPGNILVIGDQLFPIDVIVEKQPNKDVLFQSEKAKPFDGKEVAKTKLPEGATHIDVDGVSHPALNSNGQPIHWSEEGTRNFWRWFGDSKAVDTDGRPLVLYHGTNQNITAFDPARIGLRDAGFFGSGFYSTPDEGFAQDYADTAVEDTGEGEAAAMPLYVSLQNPFIWDMSDEGADATRAALAAAGIKRTSVRGNSAALGNAKEREIFNRAVREQGYDGVIVRDEDGIQEVVAFRPEQIKSATGNSGAFDGSNPNFLHQNKQDPRGTFDPVTRDITLMPDSDLSTYLHESGHLYLEVMASLAAHETASEGLRADMDAALKWFGVKGENASERLAAWNAMTLEEKRNFHEKWAESFEQYLFEGVAPSPELREAFKNFRQWLTHVYKSMAQFLVGQKNAKLNDEMRGVFDRILASEEQINAMREARNMLPLFTVRPANITNDEWERYQKASKDFVEKSIEQLTSRSLRDMKWLSNAKNKTLRKLQMEAAQARRESRMEARTAVLGQPVYRAWQFLTAPVEGVVARNKQARSSEHVDTARDSLFTAIAKLGGLNKEEAVSQYGIDPKDFLRKGGVFGKPVLRKEGGLSPDAMAEALSQFNYLPLDEHGKWDILDLEDLLREEAAGNPQYSTDVDMDVLLGEPQRAFFDTENVEYMGGRLNRIDIRNMFDDIQLAEMAGIDPFTGEKVADMSGQLQQPAFHGSPYKFDKFSLEHIGKGEGAQAYGWGLYFAGNKEVAEYYRETLAIGKGGNNFRQMAVDALAAEGVSVDDDSALTVFQRFAMEMTGKGGKPASYARKVQNASAPMRAYDTAAIGRALQTYVEAENKGQLYKVEIPEDDTYLLWDKPLIAQSEKVKAALRSMDNRVTFGKDRESVKQWIKITGDIPPEMRAMTGWALYSHIAGKLNARHDSPKTGSQQASEYLHSIGIRGIKYLDGSSRGAGDGNYNYVIFDDSAVKILETYYQLGDDDALRKEFTDTEKAYGGEAAYEKAKADGKTKLNYRQWVQVRTPRFKEWFGDWENDPANASKGIDQDTGEPLVVYHGTDATRTVFDRKHLGRSSGRGTGTDWGFFFAKDRDHAEYWANNAGGDRVVESVYLRIENPLVIEDSGNDGGATLDRILDERLQDSDHDGAIIHGMQDDDSGELRTAYLVFDSEQIKSAIGNSGAFDGSNPNILRQNKKNKDTDLFVAHNLSEENLIHADELGGLAAPSLGVSRTTTGGFDGFGGITLLADKEILTDRYARTFDADVYSPRHPRAQENISYDSYIDLVQRIKANQGEVEGLDFRVDHDSLMRNGANDLANSEAFQNYYLVSKGIIIKPKKAKAAPAILNAIKYLKKNAKHDAAYEAYNLRDEDWFKSLAEEHYKAEFEKWKNLRDDFTPAELVKYGPFEEDGSLKYHLYNELALLVENYHKKGGQDSAATRGAIAKHFRTDKGSAELQEFARAELEKISSGKQLVKYTKNGNQKRSAYTLENIVAEMTRELRGGEGFNYGAGSVRSAFAFEFKHNTIESIKSFKKNIVSKQEMDKVRDDANNKLSEALDRLAKFYKYDSTSWGYTNDASSAIAEGPKGWSSAFKMTTESKKIITDLVTYLSNLPSEYFETKMQRAVGIGEFKTAVVPKGISAKAMAILEKNGLNVVTYDPKKEGSRTAVIAKQEDILFQKKGKDSKPKNRTLESMGVLSDDGIHPDLLADYFGFPSVEAMVKALLTAPDPLSEINRLTDEIMVQRYADLATPQAIEQAALAALHSEAHSKFLATELAILNRAVGKPRLVMQAAKQYADRIVYALRIADLNPAQYEMQAAKAGKETEKLLGQNKTADAAMAKRNQILHDATARRVREEKESVAKALRFFDRTEKAARNGKLRADVGAQVLTLLDTYDLRKGTTLKAAELADRSLAEFVQQQSEAMDMPMPSLADAVLRGGVKRSYKTMSVEEFNGLVDAVKYLEAVGRREYAMYKAVRDQSFAQERSAILERLREYWPDAFDEEGNPLPTENAILKTGAYNAKKKARSAVHELLTPETVTNILEGGEFGQVHDSLFARLSNAMTDRSILMKELHEKLQPFMDAYTWKERREFGKKDIGTAAIGEPLSRENALVAALLAGSKEGRDRLANYGWNDARIAQVVNLLDAKDIALANAIFDMFDNTLWPKLEALNKRTMGVSPPKVLPIALQAKNGTLTGGYFPIRYDGDMDARSSSFDDKQALDLMKNGIGLSAKTNQSSSQARVDGVKMRPLLSLSVMSRVAGETAHDISLREAVMDSARLLNNAEIAQGIQNIVGMEGWKSLKKNLGDIASPPHDAGGMFAGAANFARRNVVTALMSGVGTAVQNFTGLLPAFSRVHKGLLLKEIADVPHLIEKYKDTIEKSAYMRERFGQFERDLVHDVDKLGMKKGVMPDQSVWFAMMAWVDRAVSVPVWQTAYREGAAKGVDAVEYADHIVRQTQGGGRLIDRAPIMRGGALQQLFTMFYSYFNGQLNLVARDAALAKREVAQGEVSKAAARLAASAIFVWILPAVVSELTRQAPDDEDDEDKLKRVVRATILYPTAMIPLLRDFAPFVYDKIAGNRAFDPRLTPVQGFVSTLSRAATAAGDIGSDDFDEKDFKALMMGIGFTFNLPAILFTDVVLGTKALLDGETDDIRAPLIGTAPSR